MTYNRRINKLTYKLLWFTLMPTCLSSLHTKRTTNTLVIPSTSPTNSIFLIHTHILTPYSYLLFIHSVLFSTPSQIPYILSSHLTQADHPQCHHIISHITHHHNKWSKSSQSCFNPLPQVIDTRLDIKMKNDHSTGRKEKKRENHEQQIKKTPIWSISTLV